MTWTARVTVQDVGDGPAPIDVLAAASADETYSSKQLVQYEGGDTSKPVYKDVEVPTITSNTEGKISSIELRFQLDTDSTSLKPGDTIQVTGHFQS